PGGGAAAADSHPPQLESDGMVSDAVEGPDSTIGLDVPLGEDVGGPDTEKDAAGCTPTCAGKDCGSDGCGGTCGKCMLGTNCADGICTSGCSETFTFFLEPSDAVMTGGWSLGMSMVGEGEIAALDPGNPLGNVVYRPQIPCDDTWTIWVRFWEDGEADSYFVRLDGAPIEAAIFEGDCTADGQGYGWNDLNWRGQDAGPCEYVADPWRPQWDAGEHTVEFSFRESLALAEIIVTNDEDFVPGNAGCVPDCGDNVCGGDGCGGSCGVCDGTCVGGLCSSQCSEVITFELQPSDASVTGNWGLGSSMLGEGPINLLDSTGGTQGNIRFKPNIPCADEWHVWVRYFQDGSNDSYFATLDGSPSPAAIFEGDCSNGGQGYGWAQLNWRDAQAAACDYIANPWVVQWKPGEHVIEFSFRESAAMGRILLTNDPNFVPGSDAGGDLVCDYDDFCTVGTGCVCLACSNDGFCSDAEDCVCPDCTEAGFCSGGCQNDGVCSPYYEGCSCADCAQHPSCG
ncbi:MAG: hypothetical protein ACI9OJ_003181, partial [Myxococcota bacterium]